MDWMLSVQNNVAHLPALVWQQWWMSAGWSIVVAWLVVSLADRWTSSEAVKVAAALLLGLWVWLPGPWGAAHWLGLAFQAPSLTTGLLCAVLLVRKLLASSIPVPVGGGWSAPSLFLAWCGVVLGWALLLDTLGLWPVSFYNWGFGATAPAVALGMAALPWIVAKRVLPHGWVLALGVAVMLFLALRLPSGNLFDALIDPWLWCFLQFTCIRQFLCQFKPASA